MKKIYKILISLLVAASLLTVSLFAGCAITTIDTVSVTATDSQTDGSSDTQADGSTDTTDSTDTGSTDTGTSSDNNTTDGGTSTDSGTSADSNTSTDSGSSGDSGSSASSSSGDSGSSGSSSALTASGYTASYNTASGDTYSVAENLLSAVTIYASSLVTTTTTSHTGGMFPGYGGGTTTYTTTEREVYTGSGVIYEITDDYVYIVTCYHVIYCETLETVANESIYMYLYGSEYDVSETTETDSYGCNVYDYGDTYIECDFVGGSWSEDVAVLRADKDDVLAINDGVREVTFSQDYGAGDTAIAIGNYGGEGIMVSQGIVAVESEDIDLTLGSTTNTFRVMRLDINIYSGNSGGGLFDENGCYIGMVNAMSTQYTNYAFAIPATVVCNSIDNIIYYAGDSIYSADLGAEVEAASSKYVYDSTSGTGAIEEVVTVTSVTSGSPAAQMGLAKGDIITAVTIDGVTYSVTRTFNLEDLELIIFSGSKVTVTYTRDSSSATSAAYTFTADDIA